MNIKNNHFKISCDVDEVLLPCVPLAIELANEEIDLILRIADIV